MTPSDVESLKRGEGQHRISARIYPPIRLTAPLTDGWRCPRCGNCWAPQVVGCAVCNPIVPPEAAQEG